MKRYEVVRDLQGGDFGMGRQFTARDWLDQAVEWRDADDSWNDWGDYGDGKPDTRQVFIDFWTDMINAGKEQLLIDYISDMWQIEIEEVKGE